jgi:hypothetical protein
MIVIIYIYHDDHHENRHRRRHSGPHRGHRGHGVAPDNTVVTRGIVTGERIDQRWIVEQGLKPGETVIVDGLQKVRPGARVTPRPYHDPVATNGQ